MISRNPFSARATLVPLAFLTCLTAAAPAAERREPAVAAPAGAESPVAAADVLSSSAAPTATVAFDTPGDGALWARGADYKMRFDGQGATYYPALGRSAPRSEPHAFSPASVTVGGQLLAYRHDASATRAGDRVEIDRGAFVEAYELEPRRMEQLFVFPALPRTGEIVVRIPVGGQIAAAESADGLELRGEHGRVTYSRAVAIDAEGRRAGAPTRLVDGAIEIRVGADFVAGAALPLTIDPTVTNVWVDSISDRDTTKPDACWDPDNGVWLAVFEQYFSATDMDIYAQCRGATGTLISGGWVDFTTASWTKPRVAWNGVLDRFLVVAERVSTTPRAVVGRTVESNGTILTLGSQIDIGGSAAGDKTAPDVGGDPHGSQGYFCVVFQHEINAQESEIGYRMCDADGTPFGVNPTYLPHVFNARDSQPAISRTNATNQWLVVWRRNDPIYRGDIYGAHIAWSGGLVDGPFGITTFGLLNDSAPCVSSPLQNTLQYMVGVQRNSLASTNYSVWVVPVDGTTAGQQVDVTVLENSGMSAVAQVEPSIDSDGAHFLLTYSEYDPNFLNYDVFASDLFLAGSQVGISQAHVNVNHMGLSQRYSRVAAQRGTSGSHRYFLAYEIRQSDTEHDIAGALFDGYVGGSSNTFCFGDGNEAACPCGNSGELGKGCANSVFATGAALTATGLASVQADSVQLHASGMPNATCLFFQGTTSAAPAAFGDGLRCVNGTVVRLAARQIVNNGYAFPTGIDLPLSATGLVPAEGGARYYQVWYRNSAAFCTAATFNITNGVTVLWAR